MLADEEEGEDDAQEHEEEGGDEHVVGAHGWPGVRPPARVVVVDGLVPRRGVPEAAVDHHGHGGVELLDPRHALAPEGALPDDGGDAEDPAERDDVVGGDVDLFFFVGGCGKDWGGGGSIRLLHCTHAAIPGNTHPYYTINNHTHTHQPHEGA